VPGTVVNRASRICSVFEDIDLFTKCGTIRKITKDTLVPGDGMKIPVKDAFSIQK